MAIDHVHDLQTVYRKLLDCMSRPGTLASIQVVSGKIDEQLLCYDATFLCALTLFDAEVTFHVIPKDRQDFIGKLSEYTLANYAPIQEADFVIALKEATESDIIQALANCKKGSLIDPQLSATWIVERSAGTKRNRLILTGPGIKTESELQTALTAAIWQARNECVKEYPLGVDWMLVDDKAQVACLPRTTNVTIMEVK